MTASERPRALRQLPDPVRIPFAVEWSVPFEGAVFHLGIHNLPESQAHLIMDDLAAYTENPSAPRLMELLAALHEFPEVLDRLQPSPLGPALPGAGEVPRHS